MSLSPPMASYNTAADPSAELLSSSCLDFLLIELVPLAHRVTTQRDAAAAAAAAALPSPPLPHPPPPAPADIATSSTNNSHAGALPPASTALTATSATAARAESVTTSHHGTAAVAGSAASAPRRLDDDEHLDAMHYRLESQGYRVGQGLVERFSKDRPRFNDTLDVIKFLCKDLWSLVFGKNIDNLKTNHRGVYVLTDNVFRPFSRMSTEAGSQAVVRAQPFLWFPCGIVRGALAALGINATVQAEVNELPGAVFQIKTIPAKP